MADRFPNLVFQLGDLSWISIIFDKFSLAALPFRQTTIMSGFVIAMIAILETMISAKMAGQMTSTKFGQQRETLGVAMANLASGLFGGLPTTAVLIRTALNVKSGATSYLSAIFTGLFVLSISRL